MENPNKTLLNKNDEVKEGYSSEELCEICELRHRLGGVKTAIEIAVATLALLTSTRVRDSENFLRDYINSLYVTDENATSAEGESPTFVHAMRDTRDGIADTIKYALDEGE
jgi:hypothetical protein